MLFFSISLISDINNQFKSLLYTQKMIPNYTDKIFENMAYVLTLIVD